MTSSPASSRAHSTVWHRFSSRPANVGALAVAGVLVLLAAGADLVASDRPLVLRLDGTLYLLPNLFDPVALRGLDHDDIAGRLVSSRGDFAWTPALGFGPHRTDIYLPELPARPTAVHPMGTDETGRDVLSRLLHGTRVSLAVGFGAVLLYVLLGGFLGAIAGWYGGWVDAVVSRSVEVMLTFPTLLLALCVVALIDRPSVGHLVLVVGLTRWPDVARLVRGEVLRIKTLDYVAAAKALGASDLRILLRHVIPNASGPVLVVGTLGVASAVLIESSLSFLGFGTPPPTASWGEILTEAQRYAASGAWWLAVFPGAAIFLTVAAFNVVGEGLRDALDPTL